MNSSRGTLTRPAPLSEAPQKWFWRVLYKVSYHLPKWHDTFPPLCCGQKHKRITVNIIRAVFRGVAERGVFTLACQYTVSRHCRTGGRPNCTRQSLASAASVRRVAAEWNCQGESNMHQIVVTVSCRLCPPLPQGEFAVCRYRKTPCFYGEALLFLQTFLYESTVFPHRAIGGKR